jgi:hypothetical protein
MTDTIDLLEAIGQDASLRYASAEELTNLLEQAQASEALVAAAAGDASLLREQLGLTQNLSPQVVQNPGHEEEEEEEPSEAPAPDENN